MARACHGARVSIAALVAIVVAIACFSPTEIELDASTDVDCGEDLQTAIFVNGTAGSIGNAYGCADGGTSGNPIGTFVIAPSGSRDAHVSVEVALLRGRAHDIQDCRTNDSLPDCIVSRRAFAFEKHHSQYVDVRLYQQCFGHHCPEDQTCVPDANGAPSCVTAVVAPNDDPCVGCTSGADPPFAGSGRDAAADVAAPDAPPDAPAPLVCMRPAGILAAAARPLGRILGTPAHLIWQSPGFGGFQVLSKSGGAVQNVSVGGATITLWALSPDGTHLVASNGSDRLFYADTSGAPPWTFNNAMTFPLAPSGISSIAVNDAGEILVGATGGATPMTAVFYDKDAQGGTWKALPKTTMKSIELVASSRTTTVFSTDLTTTFFDDVSVGRTGSFTFTPLELVAGSDAVAYATPSEVGTLSEAPANKVLTTAMMPRDLVVRPNLVHFVSDASAGATAIHTVNPGGTVGTHVTDVDIVGLAVDDGCFFYWSGGNVRVAGP